jgi:hypothetical protein
METNNENTKSRQRYTNVSCRITPKEKADLTLIIGESGTTMSEYLRERIFKNTKHDEALKRLKFYEENPKTLKYFELVKGQQMTAVNTATGMQKNFTFKTIKDVYEAMIYELPIENSDSSIIDELIK